MPPSEWQEIETALKNYLGVKNIFWLAKGPKGDDTHGHVDDLARFVDPNTIVVIEEKNKSDVNYAALQENLDLLRSIVV